MENKKLSIISIANSTVQQISIDKAYKMAIRAKRNRETERANRILSIIIRAIKEDAANGYYTGKVRFVGTAENRLLSISTSADCVDE